MKEAFKKSAYLKKAIRKLEATIKKYDGVRLLEVQSRFEDDVVGSLIGDLGADEVLKAIGQGVAKVDLDGIINKKIESLDAAELQESKQPVFMKKVIDRLVGDFIDDEGINDLVTAIVKSLNELNRGIKDSAGKDEDVSKELIDLRNLDLQDVKTNRDLRKIVRENLTVHLKRTSLRSAVDCMLSEYYELAKYYHINGKEVETFKEKEYRYDPLNWKKPVNLEDLVKLANQGKFREFSEGLHGMKSIYRYIYVADVPITEAIFTPNEVRLGIGRINIAAHDVEKALFFLEFASMIGDGKKPDVVDLDRFYHYQRNWIETYKYSKLAKLDEKEFTAETKYQFQMGIYNFCRVTKKTIDDSFALPLVEEILKNRKAGGKPEDEEKAVKKLRTVVKIGYSNLKKEENEEFVEFMINLIDVIPELKKNYALLLPKTKGK